jgi:uncharacterized phiE125 gp8 family phage protein
MTLKLITAPATEPVTLAEAKVHLRCGDDEDALLGVLIQSAREAAEHQLGRALITQTWERIIDAFPAAEIELGMPPVDAVVSVVYIDAAGDSQTLASTEYSLDADTSPGWVLPSESAVVWPNTLDTANAVRVRFTCGYGAASDVPAAIKAWMLLRIGTLYKLREEVIAGKSLAELPGGYVDRLLDPFRVWGV